MNSPLNPIPYEPIAGSDVGTVTACGDAVQINLPPDPKWTYWVAIATPLFIAIPKAVLLVVFVRLALSVSSEVPAVFVWVLVGLGASVLLFLAMSCYQFLMYRHWGRHARLLVINSGRLELTFPGWWYLKTVVWPRSEVRSLNCNVDGNSRATINVQLSYRRRRSYRVELRNRGDFALIQRAVNVFCGKEACR